MQRFIATLLAFVIFVTMNVIISYPFGREGEEISYDEAIQYISDTSASSVNVYPIHDFANLEIKDDSTSDAKKVWVSLPDTDSFISFVTAKVQNGEKFNIKVNEKSNIISITYTILNYIYAIALAFAIFSFLTIPFSMRRRKNEDDDLPDFKKLISGEDSKVGYTPIKTNVKLTDVAGMQEVKRGQCLTSIKRLQELTKLSPKKISTAKMQLIKKNGPQNFLAIYLATVG